MTATSPPLAAPQRYLEDQIRWHPIEMAFWLATLLPFVIFPNYLQLASQVAITALFALSLDLILGYAGIVSLGHAAYFGFGSYTAGLIAKWGWGEPLTGLLIAGVAAGLLGYATSFVIARFRHLALIMITLGLGLLLHEAANSASWLTGGADGLQGVRMWKLLGIFEFDLYGYVGYAYSLDRAVPDLPGRTAADPFAIRSCLARHSRKCGAHAGDRSTELCAHPQDLHHRRRRGRCCRWLLAQTTETVSLDTLSFQRSADVLVILILGGAGRLYGGIVGAIIYMVARDQFSGINPQYWYFWIGALLVAVVIFLPNGILGGLRAACCRRGGAGRERTGALHARSGQELRLAYRRQGHRARTCRRRTSRSDRTERGRQDHADQPDHRNAQARRRPHLSRRRRDHGARARASASNAASCAPSRSIRCFPISMRSKP